ncbi:MAG: SPOR domain-containing protein [Gemmatimonadota bacterium]
MPDSGATSPGRGPAPIPFEPEAGGELASVDAIIPDADRIPALVLVAGEAARAGGWAARSAVALAAGFGDRRTDVLLADLSPGESSLSDLLDVPGDDEGLADVFLFGASLRRAARAVPGRGFRFAPTGPYVPDHAALLAHPRWHRLIRQFGERDGLLLVHVAAEAPGMDALARRVGHAVVLAASEDERERIAGRIPYACSIDAVLVPPADEGGESAPGPAARSGRAAEAGDAAGPSGAAAAAGPEEEPAPSEDELIHELAVIHRESKRRRSSLVVLAIVLFAALGAAGWFVLREPADESASGPGESESSVGGVEAAAVEGAPRTDGPASVPGAGPIDSPIPYSVVIESHRDLDEARDRIATLRDAQPDILFYIAPVLIEEEAYHRVLAGPVIDSSGAASLIDRLVEAGVMVSPEPWAVRSTAQAFHLGDFQTRDAARARARELDEAGIPVYVVEVPFNAGSPRYRIYGGAYQGESEARLMARLLADHGLEAELVRRIGRPVS